MSRITKQIAAVEFQANSRQANAALESIRADADKARRTIAEMQEAMAKGITTMKDADGIEFDVAKKLQEATKAARDFDHAAQALIKGAKAFDELWKNAKLGTIEELNAAQIKAGINGGKVRADRLKLGDAEDRKAAAAIQDMIDEGQRVLDKLKLNTQNLIQTFESGGRVAEDVLKREMKTLEDLMHLSQQGSEEWQTYYRQYHTIGDEVERLQKEERKLRGEIVDREDALRVASQADKEATEQAIAAAKERVRIGQEAIKQKREEVELHKTAAEAAQADVDDARRELAAKREESSELHKTTEERREAARQRVKDARDAADAEKRAFDEVKESLKQNLDTANGRVEELKKKLAELDAQPAKENPVTEAIITGADEAKTKLAQLQEELSKMGYSAAKLPSDADLMKTLNRSAQTRYGKEQGTSRGWEGRFDFDSSIEEMFNGLATTINKDDEFWQSEAKERIKNKLGGFLDKDKTLEDLKAFQNEWSQIAGAFHANPPAKGMGSYDEALSYIDRLIEKTVELKTIQEKRNEFQNQQAIVDGLQQETAATEKQTQASKQAADADKERTRLQGEMAKATADQTKAQEEYNNAEKKYLDAEQGVKDAETEKNKVFAETLKQRRDMGTAVEALETKEQQRVGTLQQEQQAQAKLNDEIDQHATDVMKANQEIDQLQTNSIEKMEQAIKVLDVWNRKTNEPGGKEWVETEERIGSIQQRIDDLKQKSKELRGEVMSLSDALGMAGTIDGGGASVEKMEQAIKTLTEAKRKATDQKDFDEYGAAIDKISQKLKEATSEWMSLSRAEEIARQAGENYYLSEGKSGFVASPEEIQKATQALERQRDALIKTIQTKKANGEATAAEERKLDDLTKKLRDLKFEQDNVNMSQEKMRMLMKQPAQAVSLDELRAAIKRADGELRRMEGSLGKNSKEYKAFAEQVKVAKNTLKDMEGAAKASASAWEKAVSRLKTYVGLYMGFNIFWQKVTGTAGDLLTLSDKMGEVRKTTQMTADQVGRLSDALTKLDTRTSLTGLMEFSSLAGSIGLKTQEDVQGFTEAANMLSVSLPELGSEASRTLMKIADATGDLEKNGNNVRETLERVGSTVIALRANSAAAAGPITDFVSRVGAVGAQAGISIDQIAALGATVDALGGRVEMSATALSRMIPAIKNNSFAVAQALKITESELKGMSGIEQMVAIFRKLHDSVKGFDMTTEEGMNAAADAVENMLGRSASMQEVMKVLNQQGARAGIVFGLLSQNVDTLEKQLRIAGDAYKDNTALMEEYNKMNDTAAAKWERLKNQLEEAFVSDRMQRLLGGLIDGLRILVDMLVGDSGMSKALRYLVAYAAIFKAKWAEAIGSGIIATGKFIWSMRASAIAAEADAAAKAAAAASTAALGTATEETTKKTNLFSAAWGKMSNAMKANIITAAAMAIVYLGSVLWDAHKAAQEAAAAIRRVKEKTDEEKAAVDELFKPLKNANLQHEEKVRLIKDINSKYGSYLSKMLTEASNAQEIARAYEAINQQLERKNILEGMEANKKEVHEKRKGTLDSAYNEMDSAVGRAAASATDASRISAYISKKVKDAMDQGLSGDALRKSIQKELGSEISSGKMKEYVQIISGGQSRRESADQYIAYAAKRYYETQMKVQGEVNTANKRLQADMDNIVGQVREAADKDIPALIADFDKALGKGSDAKKYNAKESSAVVEAFDAIKAYYDLHRDDLTEEQKKKLTSKLDTSVAEFRNKADNSGGGGGGGKNPYGDYNDRVDPYEQWDANALVARRKEMLERVKALANGADVQAVLSEDKRFMDEATRKGIKNMRDAIAWYNEERLKIQEELDARNLTPTGDWKNPEKGGRSKKKPKTPESEGAIAELDRYYSERKELIEEARANEQMTEAEYNRRLDALEQEHLTKRSELRQTFTSEDKQFIQQFRQWWASVKELDEVSWTAIEAEWIAAWERDRKYNNREAQKDLTAMQAIVVKQLKEIEAIIAKERPFNGITDNLQNNLTKMGLLFKDGVPENGKFMEENTKRLTFLLKEAENAYSLTFDQLAEDMRKNRLGSWADAIINSENADKEKRALIAQLHEVYDSVQDAIKKEASQVKKQVDIAWNDAILPNGKSMKATYEAAISALGVEQSSVSRANNLIGAGVASERVADRLAIKQLQLQLRMQEHYYNLVRKTGQQRVDDLLREAKLREDEGKTNEAERLRLDAKHAQMSLNLSLAKEETELAKQREEIIARTEESQNRLYTELKEWADLLTSSLQGVMEASNAGNAEYYNERAKLNLTGKGGPGAGTYVVIDNAGTSDATAHYEYLDERAALERQHEIEQQNAQAEAMRKMWDDINMKLSETITDQLNAMLQNQSIDANTQATIKNTEALANATNAFNSQAGTDLGSSIANSIGQGLNGTTNTDGQSTDAQPGLTTEQVEEWKEALGDNPMLFWQEQSDLATERMLANMDALKKGQQNAGKSMQQSAQTTFAKMTMAANMYGIAYQAMSNENLSTTQKFEMMALQAVGNYAISALTTEMAAASAKAATDSPGVLGTLWKQLGWAAAPVFAIFTGLLGGLMGLASSKISSAKSQIAQATGASVGAGRLATGMLTYAEGNVNELTDPASLTPGRQYNVDGADGRTYRARYMGKDAKTHITNGPEFHLVGEKGREAIIDAHTTRLMQTDDTGIWQAIQTLYNGGRVSGFSTRRGRGVRTFAEGNINDFEDAMGGYDIATDSGGGGLGFDPAALQASLDRNSDVQEALLERLQHPLTVAGTGSNGVVAMYDKLKKEAKRQGVKYI